MNSRQSLILTFTHVTCVLIILHMFMMWVERNKLQIKDQENLDLKGQNAKLRGLVRQTINEVQQAAEEKEMLKGDNEKLIGFIEEKLTLPSEEPRRPIGFKR